MVEYSLYQTSRSNILGPCLFARAERVPCMTLGAGRRYSAQINENEHKGDRLIDGNTAISPERRLTRNNESSLRRRVSLCTAWCAQTVWTGQRPTSSGVCINVATGSATDRGSRSRCTVNSGTCLMSHGRKVKKPRREKGVLI